MIPYILTKEAKKPASVRLRELLADDKVRIVPELYDCLSAKAAENEIVVVDGLKVDEIKTKAFKEFLSKIGISGKALVVTETVDEKVVKSARNIAGVQTSEATVLNAYVVLNNSRLVIAKDALEKIEEVYA